MPGAAKLGVISMTDDVRRARIVREMEHPFVPDYDAGTMPSPDKRAAYALEHIAYRMGRLDDKLGKLVDAIAALTGPH